MNAHKYKLRYELRASYSKEGFTAEEVDKEVPDDEWDEIGRGGTDALYCCSIIKPEDGSLSYSFFPLADSVSPLTPVDIFKLFGTLANSLSKDENLPQWAREIANQTGEAIQKRILGGFGWEE